MRFLRTVSTSRLLATLAGLVIAAAGGTAIALAAAGSGPVPRARSLAGAIHSALAAKALTGVTAQVTFTNTLIGSSDIQGSDPILTGATGRLWLTKDHFRLELQSGNGDAQIVEDNGSFWAYDPSSNTLYKGTLPASNHKISATTRDTASTIPTVAQIQSDLNQLAAHLRGLGATPTDVAGQPAYRVRVSPKQPGGLLGSLKLAWDAVHGVPLDFAVYAKGDSTPVLELKATGISYGSVARSDVEISPPRGATVVDLTGAASKPSKATHGKLHPLAFRLAAPSQAAGLKLTSKRRLGSDAELLFYGKGLGGVAVLERLATQSGGKILPAGSSGNSSGGDSGQLSLPTRTIDGVTAQELDTELGTVVQFQLGKVAFVVFGSVPPATANGVARAL